MPREDDRGVSPVIGVVLLVATVVLLAAGVFFSVSGTASQLSQPKMARIEAGTLEADEVCEGGYCDQTVRLRNVAGGDIDVSETEIVVELPNRKSGRLVDLPSDDRDLDDENVEGDDVFSQSALQAGGAITEGGSDTDGVWSSGETVRFRIKQSGDGMSLDPGDEVRVRVVDTASGTVIFSRSLTAE
ncbi:MAG: type IV pilin [Halobacteria archaeon]|nr:type IV pilin [Halobacteria archaeon]